MNKRKHGPGSCGYLPGYDSADLTEIEEKVNTVKEQHPEFTDRRARVFEIINRHQGEAGLSVAAVNYLVGCILYLDNTNLET